MDVTKSEAEGLRDSMAKTVYERLFNWIIAKVNKAIGAGNHDPGKNFNFIGLLDIFGFEIFEYNCFEQLCINYANEKLQQHFNNYMFQNEQREYLQEGLIIDHIHFKDNKKCIDLIEKNSSKSPSIFSLLDEFSIMNKNKVNLNINKVVDELLDSFESSLHNNEHFESCSGLKSKKQAFIIHHFAGKVEYQAKNFLEKNKDSVSPLIESLFAESSHPILNTLFTDYIGKGLEPEESKQIRGHSLAFQFKDQLNDLMKILNVSSPRYVRCIKPNNQMRPSLLESPDVRRQLICAGVLEAIRIRKIGYPIRKPLKDFLRRYKPILTYKDISRVDKGDTIWLCKEIIYKLKLRDRHDKWQIGKTKVFMKEEVRQQLERQLGDALVEHAIVIQRHIRKYLFRTKIRRLLSSRYITRCFRKVGQRKRVDMVYEDRVKGKRVIVKEFRRYMGRKRQRERLKEMKEDEDRQRYEHRMKEIQEERRRLDTLHEEQKSELERLDTDMTGDYSNGMGLGGTDSSYMDQDSIMYGEYTTPGGEYQYDDDAFKEDIDLLSDDIDHNENKELHERIEKLENEVFLSS